MIIVYLLWHTHVISDDQEDDKLIGIYSSRELAEAARGRISQQPGFQEYPTGFLVSPYTLDKDHWTEGFVTVE